MKENYSLRMMEAIKEEMQFKNITQDQMAKKIGISRSSLSKILSGHYKADFQIVAELVTLLDMSMDDVVMKKKNKTKFILEIEDSDDAKISNGNIESS